MSDRDHDRDEAIARLRELAKQLPYERPDAARVDAVRSSLLVAATTPEVPARSRWFVVGGAFAIGAVAAAAALLLVLGTGSRTTTPTVATTAPSDHRTSVEASTAADFERQLTGGDEVIRIRSGRMSLAGARVRLATADAQVEGHGRYEVAVTADAIREVTVKEGTAILRIAHQQPIFLAAGQTWHAPVITADLEPDASAPDHHATLVAPNTRPSARPDTRPSAGPDSGRNAHPADGQGPRPNGGRDVRPNSDRDMLPGADSAPKAEQVSRTGPGSNAVQAAGSASRVEQSAPGSGSMIDSATTSDPDAPATGAKAGEPKLAQRELERHFAAGMQLLKANRAADAARELGAAADAGAGDPLAADARYFQAVAFTRAGRKTEAEAALVAFLDHAPRSLRRGRAAVMLARLIAERGDNASARAWFESATHDDDPAVVAAARAGLATLTAVH